MASGARCPHATVHSDQAGYVGLIHPVSLGKCLLGFATAPSVTDGKYVIDGQFGASAGPTALSSPLLDHVNGIVAGGTEEQMRDVHASRGIASVADHHPLGDGSVLHHPRPAVSLVKRIAAPHYPVAVGAVVGAGPQKAPVFARSGLSKESLIPSHGHNSSAGNCD